MSTIKLTFIIDFQDGGGYGGRDCIHLRHDHGAPAKMGFKKIYFTANLMTQILATSRLFFHLI